MYALGIPLPNSPHAVSVSLPKWADIIGYEEKEPRVVEAMQLGYPRFVYHPLVKKLFADCEAKFASAQEFCLAFPSQNKAQQCVDYCAVGRVEKFAESIWAVVLPKGFEAKGKEFWQHAGFGIGSRLAESRKALPQNQQAAANVKRKLAQLTGAEEADIYLFQSGMAAIYTAHQLLETRNSKLKTIQLGFPYVDTLKIQQKWGEAEFIRFDDFEKLASLEYDAVFTEYPLNPLLQQVDFTRLRAVIGTTPLVVDDTLCAWQGFNALDVADIAVTSLTKFFSGIGDVMAGCLILNKKSPHYANYKPRLDAIYEDLLYAPDTEILAKNCENFDSRITKIMHNAKKLAEFLTIHNPQSTIHHSNGMISLIFQSTQQAIAFYDNLEVKKGPSLGTEYTLACPYTLLAHYTELDWAAQCGVPAHLVRISVGCEDYAELEEKFERALEIDV